MSTISHRSKRSTHQSNNRLSIKFAIFSKVSTNYYNKDLKFIIEWIPGHMDIVGNDKADKGAKKAALKPAEEQIHPQHRLKSAQYTKISANITTKVKTAWNEGTANARHFRKISRPQRFKTGVELYITRKQLTILIILRTGHCKLNSYLNKRKIIEDPTRDCGRGIKNAKHFLLLCKKYEEPRNQLRKEVRCGSMRVENLLGDRPKV
jgi:hypothetical protein